MSLSRGGIRSVAWWVTAGLSVGVLALNVDGEIELGAADGLDRLLLSVDRRFGRRSACSSGPCGRSCA